MPSARLVGHVWWQCSSGLIRIANAIVCGEGGLVGLRGVTAGDQFGPYVLRSGVGADAGCGRGLGRGAGGAGGAGEDGTTPGGNGGAGGVAGCSATAATVVTPELARPRATSAAGGTGGLLLGQDGMTGLT